MPVAVGENRAVNVWLFPGVTVAGRVPGVTAKGAEVVIDVITRSAVPVLVIVNVWFALVVLTSWLPKSCGDGATEMAASVPVPVTETSVGLPLTFEAIEIVPLATPVAVGANRPVNVRLFPGVTVAGREPGVTAKGARRSGTSGDSGRWSGGGAPPACRRWRRR